LAWKCINHHKLNIVAPVSATVQLVDASAIRTYLSNFSDQFWSKYYRCRCLCLQRDVVTNVTFTDQSVADSFYYCSWVWLFLSQLRTNFVLSQVMSS
jgi:hypothetical protein